ncbi:MAG: BLUF domain-containing protein [Burkholderiales bacterium]|nr:BLUF domain-containing protein [Burkholderiales bacterium]
MQVSDPQPAVRASDAVVARIVYASEARIHESVFSEMEGIRASALKHNEPAGVFTALLYQSGWFVQWKEGPGAALLRIMDKVAGDRRHFGLRIVHSSRGPRLLSGPWSMAIVQADETPAEMAQRVAELRHSLDQGIQYAPPAIWRKLSTPMRHPGAHLHGDRDGFHRVMVCSAVGESSFQLVHWLARRHEQEVVHRRFAGATRLDVGTDYVDFAAGGGVLRVIAMARNGLSLPLTQAFIPDYSHLVLLLCGEPERDVQLVQRVADACANIVSPPALVAVAPEAQHHEQPFALAHQLGLVYLKAEANTEHSAESWAVVEPVLAVWRDAATSGAPIDTRLGRGSQFA